MIRDLYGVENFKYPVPDGTIVEDKVKGGLLKQAPNRLPEKAPLVREPYRVYAIKFSLPEKEVK